MAADPSYCTPEAIKRLSRGILASQLLIDVYAGAIPAHLLLERYTAHGVQAYIVAVPPTHERWLVIPGTGYMAGRAPQRLWDWLRNALSCIAIGRESVRLAKEGASRCWLWGWGFLDAADLISDWLDCVLVPDDRLAGICGHSQGAAVAQILHWSRPGTFGECHAIASARPCFSVDVPLDDAITVWAGLDDPVTWLPLGARHVGPVYPLQRVGGLIGGRHRIVGYKERMQRALRCARLQAAR